MASKITGSNLYRKDTRLCEAAAQGGHLDVLIWAKENDFLISTCVCENAAYYGHYDVLKWVLKNGCPVDVHTCENIAARGDLEMLCWAIENDCPLNTYVTAIGAATFGKLNIVQYIHNNYLDASLLADTTICEHAAKNGHLETLIWCRKNGYAWDDNTYTAALTNDHWSVLIWCVENGCPKTITD